MIMVSVQRSECRPFHPLSPQPRICPEGYLMAYPLPFCLYNLSCVPRFPHSIPVLPVSCGLQVILPLYPQFSISTSGSSLRVLNEEFTRRPEQWSNKKVVHTVVSSYHDRPGYVNAMANLVAREVAQFTPEQQQEGVQVNFKCVYVCYYF